MGANARRRREERARTKAATSQQLDLIDGASFNRMVRSACSACGSSELSWVLITDLAELEILEDREFAENASAFVGLHAEAWHCAACGERGALAPFG